MSADARVLSGEHRLLGARFAEDGRVAPVLSYGDAEGERAVLSAATGVGLCDLTGLSMQLVEGASAPALVAAACAAPPPRPGTATFSAVLAGDGVTLATPLAIRTGITEYVLADGTGRAEVLAAWLDFLAAIERDGRAPFSEATITDATDVHVPLALVGAQAASVLADYVDDASCLPGRGRIRPLRLDGRIDVLCLRLPRVAAGTHCCPFLLLVPPSRARAVWRSLLSFHIVTPVGRQALADALSCQLPWLGPVMRSGDRLAFPAADLGAWGLIRDEPSYVGAAALLGASAG